MCVPGNRLYDISHAVQTLAESKGSAWSGGSSGTGSARACTRTRRCLTTAAGKGPTLKPGMVLAIEPMVNMGGREWSLADCWQVYTKDGSASAHFEHTVAVTEDGPDVLTARAEIAWTV